jgi:hypothetical protein
VTKDLHNSFLISWHDLIGLGVIPDDFPKPGGVAILGVGNEEEKGKTSREEEDVEKLGLDGAFLRIKNQFSDVLGSSLEEACGRIKGPPMRIYLNDKPVKPMKVYTARQVPVHFKEAADDLERELLQAGVIVPVIEPTDWVSPAHFVPKPDGRVRLVTDYTRLNEKLERPIHPFPSAKDLMQRIAPDSKFFAKIDAVHGYFQVPLEEESTLLRMFLLPSGRFRYTAAPMGLSASSDEFCRRTDNAFQGLPWFLKIVDDGLIQAPTEKILLERVIMVLECCRDFGIKISTKKFQWGRSLKFAGYIVSDEGVRPDPSKVAGIAEFPIPKNVTQVRSFLGLANQLGTFLPDLSHMTRKMRSLLKKGVAFTYLDCLESPSSKPLLVSPWNTWMQIFSRFVVKTG